MEGRAAPAAVHCTSRLRAWATPGWAAIFDIGTTWQRLQPGHIATHSASNIPRQQCRATSLGCSSTRRGRTLAAVTAWTALTRPAIRARPMSCCNVIVLMAHVLTMSIRRLGARKRWLASSRWSKVSTVAGTWRTLEGFQPSTQGCSGCIELQFSCAAGHLSSL